MRALLAKRHHAAMTTKTQPPTGTLILAENLSKSYKVGQTTVDVLHDVTFPVSAGETCAIMGPSGSGKSTLLYCLAGLEGPTAGGVTLLGRQLSGRTRKELAELRRRELGFVFQSYNLMPSLTAHENVELVTEIARDPMDPDEALALVGLHARTDHFPAQLSGGEQQRVAIARAVAKQPMVLLCDEPTGALDSATGRAVLRVLQDVNERLGATVLIVTHAAATAAMADRVIYFADGAIREVVVNDTRLAPEEIEW